MISEVLGFDLDGVLYDWHSLVYDLLKRDYNLDIDYYTFWSTEWRKSNYQKIISGLVGDITLYSRLFIRPSINNVLKELDKYYDLVYITQRPKSAALTTRLWLKKNDVPNYSNVYILENKCNAIRELGCAFYIEDRVELAHQIKLLTNVILVAQPWNEGLRNGFEVIFNLEELPDLLFNKLDKELID